MSTPPTNGFSSRLPKSTKRAQQNATAEQVGATLAVAM